MIAVDQEIQMDISTIQEKWVVNARNPGVSHGPCLINIGTVERVEENGYIKLAKNDDLDGREHWFPSDWIESADGGVVCLKEPADKVMQGLTNELPT
jgi:hypothetical protein